MDPVEKDIGGLLLEAIEKVKEHHNCSVEEAVEIILDRFQKRLKEVAECQS